MAASQHSKRVFMLGATGSIGRATARALVRRSYDVVCFIRPGANTRDLAGVTLRIGDVTDPASLTRDGFAGEDFDVALSCLASRTGDPADAWAIDHQAHVHAIAAAKTAHVRQFILLSAICAQKPRLAFQHAKLAAESAVMASGLTYAIVRPTAFFKSLSGQLDRIRAGKPFLLFGDGKLTACKPISDDDLAQYLCNCIEDPALHNRILPIGGPGNAITPLQQGALAFAAAGIEPRYRHVPIWIMNAIIALLSAAGKLSKKAAQKAELARIGQYYATESMLEWDADAARYDAAATPSFGTQTLYDHYASVIAGTIDNDRGDHAVF